jgi:flagellar export protein FliJ
MSRPFRLSRVLNLHTQLRKLRQHEAADLAATVHSLEANRRALRAARDDLGAEEARIAGRGEFEARSLELYRSYAAALEMQEQVCAVQVEEARAALVAKRDELVAQRREERKLLRLAELHGQSVAEEDSRLADRLLDELAIQRHDEKRKEDGHGAD